MLIASFLIAPAEAHTPGAVAVLQWTAPGDDGDLGIARRYDIRRSRTPLSMLNFAWGDTVAGAPTPGPAGTVQSCPVQLPEPGVTYYFAIRTIDDVGNRSWISNIVTITSAITAIQSGAPERADFAPPWPNPARAQSSFQLQVSEPTRSSVDAFDAAGRHVRTVYEGDLVPGPHTIEWNLRDDHGRSVPGGVYFVRVRIGSYTRTRQVVVVP